MTLLIPLTSLVAGGGEAILGLRSRGLGFFRAVEGSLLERSISKKALAMSFVTKGISFFDGGIIAYLVLSVRSDRAIRRRLDGQITQLMSGAISSN